MTRIVSGPTVAKIDAGNWAPGFLVQLNLSSILRFSTRETITLSGNIYITAILDVQNLEDDSSAGALRFNDPTLAIQTLIRTENIIGKRVQVARFYDGATASSDPIWYFDGYVRSASEGTPPEINIAISRDAASRSLSPSKRIGPSTGFNVMAPEGQKVLFRQSAFRLERAKR